MPTITVKPSEYLDQHVKPLAEHLGPVALGAYETLRGLAVGADRPVSFYVPDLPGTSGGGVAPPPAPPIPSGLQPVDPADALRDIAKAVRDAEQALNEANLAIANATAEVSLVVKVGTLAGANATMSITISPTLEDVSRKD